MKRSTALILATFFDLFAVAVLYFMAYQPLREVFIAVGNRAGFIRYNTNFFITFGCAFFPIIHVAGLIETYLPRHFNRSIGTKVVYGLTILSLLAGLVTAVSVKQMILKNGYFHCQGAAVHRKLFRNEAYVLDDDTCRRLTLEREKLKVLGARQ